MKSHFKFLAMCLASATLAFGMMGCDDDDDDTGAAGEGGTGVTVDQGIGGGGTGGQANDAGTGGEAGGGGEDVVDAGAGNEGGGGGECDRDLNYREACDPMNDCCDRGLACAVTGADANQGECLNTCDANQDPNGCGPRETCIADNADVEPPALSPGICLPGDDCLIGDAAATCGDQGDASCFVFDNVTFCYPAGESGVGAPCSPAEEGPFCAADLACVYGACQAPCGADNACGEGETCLDYSDRLDGLNFSFCFANCNIFTQEGCAAGETCFFADEMADSPTIGLCASAAEMPQGDGVHGDPCVNEDEEGESINGGVYINNACTGGHVCLALEENGPQSCLGFCDGFDQSACLGGSGCLMPGFDGLEIGLCIGECDMLAGTGCAEGESCGFYWITENTDGGQGVHGLCAEAPQTHQVGEECQVGDADADPVLVDSCVSGSFCATLAEGAPPVCLQICDVDGAQVTCVEGTSCQMPGAFGEGTEGIGICLPPQ